MDLNKLKTDSNNTETIAFRIPPRDKQALVDACNRNQLSLGKVMRLLVKEFLEHVEEIEEDVKVQRR